MSKKPHWSSLRRRAALSDHLFLPPRPQNPQRHMDDSERRLTLGDLGKLAKERQETTRSATLGDVGDWFRNKLPSHQTTGAGKLERLLIIPHLNFNTKSTIKNRHSITLLQIAEGVNAAEPGVQIAL
ncbi:hypothetical protein LB505_001267 [Fusarium chuoi]|nr:hypothetical protein LB505_001267 [Fusarium chuoi]